MDEKTYSEIDIRICKEQGIKTLGFFFYSLPIELVVQIVLMVTSQNGLRAFFTPRVPGVVYRCRNNPEPC